MIFFAGMIVGAALGILIIALCSANRSDKDV